MKKELKAAQRPIPEEPRLYSDKMTPKDILKKYPEKIAKAERGMLKGLEKRFKSNQKKKKKSKRTNPGQVDTQSTPAQPHVEGSRWIKNSRIQNNEQRERLRKRALKRK